MLVKLKKYFLDPPEHRGVKVALSCLAVCVVLFFLDYIFGNKVFSAIGFVFAFIGVVGIFGSILRVWKK